MAGGIEFKRGKLKELVLYLAQASVEDEGFGMVKLNKLLYRADFEAFRHLGHSITGETYERQEYGPVARDLPIVLDDLAASGYIVWQRLAAGPYTRKVPTAIEQPDMTQFTADELAIVEGVIRELTPHGAKRVSEWSHEQSAGWNLVERDGEAIPYETALISMRKPSPEYFEHAKSLARERGWAAIHP